MVETWKDIPEYKGHYQVSDMGRVRSIKSMPFIVLKNGTCRGNYQQVSLFKDGKSRPWRVHVLVMLCFVGSRVDPRYNVIMHANDDPKDNRLSNLSYGTQSKNTRDSIERGHFVVPRNTKQIVAIDLSTSERKEYTEIRHAVNELGILHTSISNILKGRAKRTRNNYTFEYLYKEPCRREP